LQDDSRILEAALREQGSSVASLHAEEVHTWFFLFGADLTSFNTFIKENWERCVGATQEDKSPADKSTEVTDEEAVRPVPIEDKNE
jgi:hypothetical protein